MFGLGSPLLEPMLVLAVVVVEIRVLRRLERGPVSLRAIVLLLILVGLVLWLP
jgi:hypothetical protein